MLSIHPLPSLETNYIWVLQQGRSAVAVDPGDAAPLVEYLQQNQLELRAILVTHRHADHTDGLPALHHAFPAPVHGPATIPGVTHPVRDGDTLRLLDRDWRVLATPGHTDEHVAYYGDGALFCGDVLFGAGCGRIFDGTPQEMYASLMKLNALPPDTLVYSAHEYTLPNLRFAAAVEPGNPVIARRIALDQEKIAHGQPTQPSALADEQATNPFLRCDVPEVIANARLHMPQAHTPTEVFAALREWKNHFK
ncbi:hydroxyacylglutathione hydrolase [Formivibrio citricus]|uniref:Hydroxyacylglutathione hydrolase n=1 Tax=Formivibrio citricus TaxID=83765 RepID=A0A1I4YK60_9NEIS|nr:hydroxyacylglutathione hydrolase [Formivibrio citricus]SFN38458.1 hydroxyacylglutathione hydrolase [Formivibrio citricus]